jgi:hypothetical protein
LSKIGAEPAQRILRRVGVVNLPVFPVCLAVKAPVRVRPGTARYIRSVHGVRICDMRIALKLRGNHGGGAVRVCADGGPDIAKPVLTSSNPSAIGFQMTNFRQKLISQDATREPSVLFGTADLSGWDSGPVRPVSFCDGGVQQRSGFRRERDLAMKQMVTATGATYLSVYDAICRDDCCDELVQGNIPLQFDAGHLTAEGAIEVGRRLSAAFARKHAADVSH